MFGSVRFYKLYIILLISFVLCSCGEMRELYSGDIKIASKRYSFVYKGSEVYIPYEGSSELPANADTLLIMIHGDSLSAEDAFMWGKMLLASAPNSAGTAVFAPQFPERRVNSREKNMLFWDRRWRGGGYSLSIGENQNCPEVSSFTLLELIIDDFQRKSEGRLKNVIIAGYGSGAQFVARFAAMNSEEDRQRSAGVRFRYVAVNSSSYLYLNSERYSVSGGQAAAITDGDTSCMSYNNYKYGLENIYGYGNRIVKEQIISNLLRREIIFVAGRQCLSRTLSTDTNCGADLQGRNIYERAMLYRHHLRKVNKAEPKTHTWLIIDNAGDEPEKIFSNPLTQNNVMRGIAQ